MSQFFFPACLKDSGGTGRRHALYCEPA